MCVLQCNKSRDYCGQSCDLDYRACYSDAQAAAQREYDIYATTQHARHQPIIKAPSDFQRTAACEEAKKTCFGDCDTPYNACYKLCGGKTAAPSSCLFCL
jgi:hypothetical protein